MIKGIPLLGLLLGMACQGVSVTGIGEPDSDRHIGIRQTGGDLTDEDWRRLSTGQGGTQAVPEAQDPSTQPAPKGEKRPTMAGYLGLGGQFSSSNNIDPPAVIGELEFVFFPEDWALGFEASVLAGNYSEYSLGVRLRIPLTEDQGLRLECGGGLSYREIEITHTRRQCFFFCWETEKSQRADDIGVYFHLAVIQEWIATWDIGLDVRAALGSEVTLDPISEWNIPGRTGDFDSIQLMVLFGKRF